MSLAGNKEGGERGPRRERIHIRPERSSLRPHYIIYCETMVP